MYYIDESDKIIGDVHRTYKIKKGDTLYSVAQELDIDPAQLRKHHNRYCEIRDLIEDDFKSYLEFLILAPEKEEVSGKPEEVIREKVVLGKDYILPFRPVNTKINYGVMYTVENGDEMITIKQIIGVSWKATDDSGFHLLEIDKLSKVFINDTEADSIYEELGEKTASILYPLQVVVDQEGKWIDIHKFDEIIERWENKKEEILEDYQGEEIDKYFGFIEQALKSKEHLISVLSYNWFIRAFFSGIHVQYKDDFPIKSEVYFPLIAKSEDMRFEVTQKLEPYLDEDNLININIKGVLADDRSKTDFENELELTINTLTEEKAEGIYRARYFLNPNNYTVEALLVESVIALDVPQKITVMVSNLDENEDIRLASKSSFFMGEETQKKSFFKRF